MSKTIHVGGLIDRLALRKKVNNLFNGATQEQQMILLQVCELIESAPSVSEGRRCK